ncbi:hypothetical protein D3C74_148360 [compost metagenome]
MFRNMTTVEIRELSRVTIETLEIWLRRLIDSQMRSEFGDDYFHYKRTNGDYIIKKIVREKVSIRRNAEPNRFPRDVDALDIDDSKDILFHPELYRLFRDALLDAFPVGIEMGRAIMSRIVTPRNHLAHANHISMRQAEQSICYSHDIIDSIKKYYTKVGEEKMYNVPSIIQFSDSLGNIKYETEINASRNDVGAHFAFNNIEERLLYSGDILMMEVEIDPSFSEENYILEWSVQDKVAVGELKKRFSLNILPSHVGERFVIECSVQSNKTWHRYGSLDDRLMIYYKVLPPIE